MMNQLQRSIFVATVLSVCCVQSAWAEVNSEDLEVENSGGTNSLEQVGATSSIPQISELEPSATTVDEWITQIAQSSTVEIIEIQVNPSDFGLEVTLEITGTQPTPSTSVIGNALIINIPDAVLSLPDADEFQQSNPAEGIALISATNLPNNRVRVAITGADAPPTVSINAVDQNLILSITSNAQSIEATEEDAIQVVVTDEQEEGYIVDNSTTATRTDTPILEVPGSIQVVPQQVIQEQNALRLPDIFRNVSGIGEEGGFGDALDQFNIRGFTATGQIFRNGIQVPNVFSPLVETENLERVEILKGPASVLYGALEPGGIINLVTMVTAQCSTARKGL
ncbi:TonB-dependent receptor plug domain-containing protein [Leptolyngbya sp. FACHB-671]|uniref:TonB-dependent receptor plug domain-containing protein n=1 Tax=Leptolyngbya sp. FACHB-671 TaxID=2692812 RepID=UPI001681CE58|nr:TonB-dependent receptor plug domain-containing protein [Leptolyngbya sp. FACHB-671]MBD2068743.1 TonB-dependent receptor plug domain-containing protein [Leptolyngbya sp. FACHB-671]